MKFYTLETERLMIREFAEEDFLSVHGYASNPEVTLFMPFEPNNEEDTAFFLKTAMGYQMQKQRNDYELAVVLKENNLLIGGCGIHITDISSREGTIGYCYGNKYWRKGYASEAANAILGFGFNQLGLHRIFATCAPDNIGSVRVMEKIGMQYEGRLRDHKFQKGRWRDSLVYSILENEFNESL